MPVLSDLMPLDSPAMVRLGEDLFEILRLIGDRRAELSQPIVPKN